MKRNSTFCNSIIPISFLKTLLTATDLTFTLMTRKCQIMLPVYGHVARLWPCWDWIGGRSQARSLISVIDSTPMSCFHPLPHTAPSIVLLEGGQQPRMLPWATRQNHRCSDVCAPVNHTTYQIYQNTAQGTLGGIWALFNCPCGDLNHEPFHHD